MSIATTALWRRILPVALAVLMASGGLANAWWDDAWAGRTKLTVNPAAEGAEVAGDAGEMVLLVRLHSGNLPFESVQPDGSDLRFVSGDDKTPLAYHLEKFDPLMAEGFAWVRVPAVSGPTDLWLYYGNSAPEGNGAPDSKKTYPESARLVYHLNERGTPPQDLTANGANAETAGAVSEGTIIADGLRLVGRDPVKIPGVEEWKAGADLTLVLWVKPMNTAKEAVIVSRPQAGGFRVGLAEGGAPFIEVAGMPKATAKESVGAGTWRQIAVSAKGGCMTLYVDGREAAALESPLPAGGGAIFLGGPDPATTTEGRFTGELDEFQIYAAALPPAALRLGFVVQSGSELAGKVVQAGEAEGSGGGSHGGMLEHLSLFGDIANNMMFDGWIAIGVCVIMMIAGWTVAVVKFFNLGRMEKGNAEFLKLWREVASDLTALDMDANPEGASSLGGKMDPDDIGLLTASPLYHVYQVGSDEIRHRLTQDRHKGKGLRARSIQAIRASLDAALVHEQHRLNKGIVYLTISIAGGPYVGLLGTVVGVMITFAVIAKSGEVDVNSIAPGIASALLATTVGLLVAIPALFMYSFLNSRIKGVLSSMHVFIDEFVAKMAEFYHPPSEGGGTVPIRPVRTPEKAASLEETGADEDAEILASAAAEAV